MSFTRPLARRSAVAMLAASLAAAWLPTPAQAATDTVNVVGYSIVKQAYAALEAGFLATPAGAGVKFTNSFGASDTQTSNVANGQAADFVNLSYAPNIATLVTAGVVPSTWTSQESSIAGVNPALTGAARQTTYPTPGILTDSTVVFVVRAGNPFKVPKQWLDLAAGYAVRGTKTHHAYQIVTPNPTTSGSARWNLLSAYAAAVDTGYTKKQVARFMKTIVSDTVAQPVSGSAALSAFLGGTGDLLLAYEADALAAVKNGAPVSIIYPNESILIENPVALTNTGLNNPGAVAFYKYVFSSAGQKILAGLGFRPVLKSVWSSAASSFYSYSSKALTPITTFAPAGWATLNDSLFGTNGLVTGLEQYAGSAN